MYIWIIVNLLGHDNTYNSIFFNYLQKLEKHDEFLSRINKTLYYGKLPTKDRLSLPISGMNWTWGIT